MNGIRTRQIDGNFVTTKLTQIWSANGLMVEVGTNGHKGGDSGHGSRTILRIADVGGTDIRCNKLVTREEYGANGGVQIILGGDSELDTFIQALEYAVKTLKEQSGYTDDDLLVTDLD